MQNKTEIIEKIPSHYVGDDCIQIMRPYENALTIINQDGILFHSKDGSKTYINKYLEDERRKDFPYSNIPIHYSKVGLFKKRAYANQLFEFEKTYINISDGFLYESFAVKDNNQALLINSAMDMDKETKYMTYEELLNFVAKNDSEKIYYADLSGAIYLDEHIFPTEEKIYNFIKEQFKKYVKDFREYEQECSDTVSNYLKDNPWFLDYFEQSINKLDLSLINFNLRVGEELLLIIRINNGNITLQQIKVRFINKDNYKVDIYDIPVNKYTLEQLKFMPHINFTKEPKIPLRLNRGITREDIKEAKQMVRTLKKNEKNYDLD